MHSGHVVIYNRTDHGVLTDICMFRDLKCDGPVFEIFVVMTCVYLKCEGQEKVFEIYVCS